MTYSCDHCLRMSVMAPGSAPARQPGFDDQHAERRQDQGWPQLLTVFQLRVIHLTERGLIERFGRMARQTATQLFQGDVFKCSRLAFQRIKVDRKRPRAL